MTRFSQFAAPVVLGAALVFGAQGCASHGPEVSADSQMLSEGRTMVTATAPHDGSVYIYDDTSNDTVYSGKVDRGDSVRVDAKNNRVLLNDKVALEKDLVNDHRYQIFFNGHKEPSEADIARYRGDTTVITPAQPDGTTIVQPPPSNNTTVVQPPPPPAPRSGTTVVQPDGTVVQPGSGTTVVTPSK